MSKWVAGVILPSLSPVLAGLLDVRLERRPAVNGTPRPAALALPPDDFGTELFGPLGRFYPRIARGCWKHRETNEPAGEYE
jgi:hypothetical protein